MRSALALCLAIVLVGRVHSQGWAWAYSKKEAWFVTRALEVFPADQAGHSPYVNETISATCVLQLAVYVTALTKGQDWAAKIFDANSVQSPPGIHGAKVSWTGAYEQCMSVQPTKTPVPVGQYTLYHDFNAKYCRTFYTADKVEFSFTNCVPEGCSDEDVQTILSIPATNQPAFPVSYVDCGQDDQHYDISSMVCTALLGTLCFLVFVSTVVDTIKHQRRIDPKNKVVTQEAPPSASFETNQPEVTHGGTVGSVDNNDDQTPTEPAQSASPTDDNPSQQPGKGMKALLAFSLYSNIKSIVSTKVPANSYTCMYGIRVWSMLWIILGHTWQLGLTVVSEGNAVGDNYADFTKESSEKWTHAIITNMSVAVESFFLLSGALVTISFMNQMQKQADRTTCRHVSLFYLNRYLRLTPVLAVVVIFTAGFFNFLVNGPMVKGNFPEGWNCRTAWWTTIFYINNLVPPYITCLGWTWYLACDFQFHLSAPIFIILLYKFKKVGLAVTSIATGLSVVIFLVTTSLVFHGYGDYYSTVYIRPWTRFSSFGVGILLGYTMFKTKCQTRLPTWAAGLGWTLAILACLIAVYGDLGRGSCSWCSSFPIWLNVAYLGTQRILFACGIAWLVFVSCCGQGGFVNTFLSWKGFIPLGKLTYTCYLIHPLVIYFAEYARSTQIHVLGSTMTFFFAAYVLISYTLALFVSAAFEVSMLSLAKLLLPRY